MLLCNKIGYTVTVNIDSQQLPEVVANKGSNIPDHLAESLQVNKTLRQNKLADVDTTNQPGKHQMTKLINLYRAMPSPTNRAKLQKYLDRHMMAICMASPDEVAFLKGNGFSI